MMDLSSVIGNAAPYTRVLLDLFAVIAGSLAVATYRRNARVRRAEWLSSLHSKFFEASTYKGVRQILEAKTEKYNALRKAIADNQTNDDVELLVDYLNFFEFVGSLCELRQLSTKEVDRLFDYYLRQLEQDTTIKQFVDTQGFESQQIVHVTSKPVGRFTAMTGVQTLFVYGTLRRGSATDLYHLVARNGMFLGDARVRGRLFVWVPIPA